MQSSASHAVDAHNGTRAPLPAALVRMERLLARYEPIDPFFIASAHDRQIKTARGADRGRVRPGYRPI
jgi:hypothetical protein